MEVVTKLSIPDGSVTPQKIYLEVDALKTCYVVIEATQYTPKTILTSVNGTIDNEWEGDTVKVTLIIPKGETLNISNSDFTGTLKTNATVINASGCDFTSQQIGDFFFAAKANNPTAVGASANFSGGTNARKQYVAVYMGLIPEMATDAAKSAIFDSWVASYLPTWTITMNL